MDGFFRRWSTWGWLLVVQFISVIFLVVSTYQDSYHKRIEDGAVHAILCFRGILNWALSQFQAGASREEGELFSEVTLFVLYISRSFLRTGSCSEWPSQMLDSGFNPAIHQSTKSDLPRSFFNANQHWSKPICPTHNFIHHTRGWDSLPFGANMPSGVAKHGRWNMQRYIRAIWGTRTHHHLPPKGNALQLLLSAQ